MRLHKTSLELIILAPVVAFLLVAGLGSYFLILNSFQEFADRTIRQSFQSISNSVYSIVDHSVDQLNLAGKTGNRKATKIRQVSTLIEIEDFSRRNEIGILIQATTKSDPVLAVGLPADAVPVVAKAANQNHDKISLPGGISYYLHRFEFIPWNWQIVLLKNASTYDSLLSRARYFYLATGIGLFLIAVFLIVYLRRTIAHPIHQIVDRIRAGKQPAYRGIREFEFLSDSIGQMMAEVADKRDHLEEMVRARTVELESANKVVSEKNKMLESLSSQLSKYLSPQVFASIFSGAQNVEITSRRKKLTICFSDIVSFTEITDKMEPEDLTQLLNHYLTEMSDIALQYGATIDKYVGDAINMFFGDPETRGVKEDALACVKMALAMQKRVGELAEYWRNIGIETPFRCRIGIHSGYCTVGNFGSENRMDYTIHGGGVNLASRLETTANPGEIFISYETFALVRDQVHCEEQGKIRVKGIPYPVTIYRVVDLHENLAQDEGTICAERAHLKLDVDVGLMSAEERQEAATVLQEVANLLSKTDAKSAPCPKESLDA